MTRQSKLESQRNDEFALVGKTAVVTGSASGIGRAIALELAAAGADVVVCARQNITGARQVAEEIGKLQREALVLTADLSQNDERARSVANAWQWRDIDIWINNAGADVLTGDSVERSFDEKLNLLWEVDVCATISLSREVGQRMKAGAGGVILNMGWDQAETGMAGDSGQMFAACKGAISAFSRSLAKSLAPDVRVNCLAPGWIRTAWGNQTSAYWDQRATNESLLNRWGEPEDVARTARFLVSPAGSFINGQVVPINGGFRTVGDV